MAPDVRRFGHLPPTSITGGSAGCSPTEPPKRKLLDQVRDTLRTMHYSKRTEEAYVDGTRRFILHHHKRHPAEMGGPEVEAFLTYLAVELDVAASTQHQALSALLYVYRHVLQLDLPLVDAVRAKRPERHPTVLSVDQVRRILDQVPPGMVRLMIELLCGTGMRLLECCRPRSYDSSSEA